MLIQSILVGLVAVFMILDSRLFGRLNFEQPLITCTLVGLVMGDVQTGLAVGATMELVTLGLMNIGASGSMAMGMNMGAIIGCAYVIQTGADVETSFAISVPMASLNTLIGTIFSVARIHLCHMCDRYVEEGRFKSAKIVHIVIGPILYSVANFIPVFCAVYFGGTAIGSLIDRIPQFLMDGFSLGANIMSFYGLALLLSTMVNKKSVPFFFIGFAIAAYSGLSLIAMSVIGGLIAIVLYQLKYDKNSGQEAIVDELD